MTLYCTNGQECERSGCSPSARACDLSPNEITLTDEQVALTERGWDWADKWRGLAERSMRLTFAALLALLVETGAIIGFVVWALAR